jgi:hypothetical protein
MDATHQSTLRTFVLQVANGGLVTSKVSLEAPTNFMMTLEQILVVCLIHEELSGIIEFVGLVFQLEPLLLRFDSVS